MTKHVDLIKDSTFKLVEVLLRTSICTSVEALQNYDAVRGTIFIKLINTMKTISGAILRILREMISSFSRCNRFRPIHTFAALAIISSIIHLGKSSAFLRDACLGNGNSRGLSRRHTTGRNGEIRYPILSSSPIDHSYMALDLYESSSSGLSTASRESSSEPAKAYNHTMAILTFPKSSIDRIANEAILEKAIKHTTGTLSVVLRCRDQEPHRTPLSDLNAFVGETYSFCWDLVIESVVDNGLLDEAGNIPLLDLVVYAQSLPNAAPEQWIYQRPDLECICGADEMMGWYSSSYDSSSTSKRFIDQQGSGLGGLKAHCDAVNADRMSRGLRRVESLGVILPQGGKPHPDVVFLEDDLLGKNPSEYQTDSTRLVLNKDESLGILGGVRIGDDTLYQRVSVGGTFDGLHYGHRKLLTLAVSSVDPLSGSLLVGVTSDEMLTKKKLSRLIPPLSERIESVRKFLDKLSPGLKNRRKIVAINDTFGPPGRDKHFDALVLSHETLPTGHELNEQRVSIGLPKLKLLCTRRTEPNSMSSTALRRLRDRKQIQQMQ